LKSISIPLSVVVLGKSSFFLCQSLQSVVFGNASRLERIEALAFSRSGLKSIEIPRNVVSIDGSAFHCVSPTSISISRDNVTFRLREWFLENFSGSTIYRYFGCCHSIVIPSSVVVLGKSSFHGCESLHSMFFEQGCRLELIEESAFSESGLKSFVIPSSIVLLSKESFRQCQSLESVIFEKDSRLEQIGELAFEWNVFKSIVIPSSVIILGKESFSSCRSLESVIFEKGSRLERIEESAFSDSGLCSIIIPSSVLVFGKRIFRQCNSLHYLVF
jgi:hypothetical protein